MNASVRELKGKLADYLRRAAAGEEITITSHGRPVARLVRLAPQAPEEELSPGELERRLAAIPGIIMPTGPNPKGLARPIPIRKREKTLSEIVLEDRR